MELEEKIAEDICEINIWKTPESIKHAIGRNLSPKEIGLVMQVLETYVPKEKWILLWRKQRNISDDTR